MSELTYFHNVFNHWKISISAQDFQDHWEDSFKKAFSVEEMTFLLYSASKLFSQKKDGYYVFKTPQDLYTARDYFSNQVKNCEALLEEDLLEIVAKGSPLEPQSIIFLIKTYNMVQIHPSSGMQELLIQQSQATLGLLSFRDQRYILRNLVGIGVYPGDAWIEAWYFAFTKKASEQNPTREDLLDVLYYMTIMDYMRTMQGENSESSPCRQITTGMLDAFRDETLSGKIVDSAIYYPANYYGYEFIKGAKLRVDRKGEGAEDNWFQRDVAARGLIFLSDLTTKDNATLTGVFQVSENGAPRSVICRLDGRPSLITDVSQDRGLYAPQIAFKGAVLNLLSPEKMVLSIPYTFLCRVAGLSTNQLMEKLLDGVKNIGPGHYVLHPDGLRPAQEAGAWEFPISSPRHP